MAPFWSLKIERMVHSPPCAIRGAPAILQATKEPLSKKSGSFLPAPAARFEA
jgi:hypothetical protein